jgi:hypothetical protein
MTTLVEFLRKYDRFQPRDADGRWATVGGTPVFVSNERTPKGRLKERTARGVAALDALPEVERHASWSGVVRAKKVHESVVAVHAAKEGDFRGKYDEVKTRMKVSDGIATAYRQNGYTNALLRVRNDEPGDAESYREVIKWRNEIDGLFKKHGVTLKQPITVHRGISIGDDKLARVKAGAHYVDRGFVSTSGTDDASALTHFGMAVARITIPKGTRVLPIFTGRDPFVEIVLPRDSEFKVIGRIKGHGISPLYSTDTVYGIAVEMVAKSKRLTRVKGKRVVTKAHSAHDWMWDMDTVEWLEEPSLAKSLHALAKQRRWPKDTPGGKGGEFAPETGAGGGKAALRDAIRRNSLGKPITAADANLIEANAKAERNAARARQGAKSHRPATISEMDRDTLVATGFTINSLGHIAVQSRFADNSGAASGPLRSFLNVRAFDLHTDYVPPSLTWAVGDRTLARVEVKWPVYVDMGDKGYAYQRDEASKAKMSPRFNRDLRHAAGLYIGQSIDNTPFVFAISDKAGIRFGEPSTPYRRTMPSSDVDDSDAEAPNEMTRRSSGTVRRGATRRRAKPKADASRTAEKIVDGFIMSYETGRVDDDAFGKGIVGSDVPLRMLKSVGHLGIKARLGALKRDSYSRSVDMHAVLTTTKGGNSVGSMSRTFDMDTKTVKHDYFELEDAYQGKDIAKHIFAASIPEYQKLGMKKVKVGAGLSRGGYAWLKYGFVPDRNSMGYLMSNLRNMATTPARKAALRLVKESDPKTLWALADSKVGKEMLSGRGWNGVLDLENKDQMDRFNAYVGKAKPIKRKRRPAMMRVGKSGNMVMAELLDNDTPLDAMQIAVYRSNAYTAGLTHEEVNMLYPPLVTTAVAMRVRANNLR